MFTYMYMYITQITNLYSRSLHLSFSQISLIAHYMSSSSVSIVRQFLSLPWKRNQKRKLRLAIRKINIYELYVYTYMYMGNAFHYIITLTPRGTVYMYV